jgi:adenosylhomocysteine nucleosidase
MTIGIISAMDSEHRRLVERLQDKNTSGDGSFRYVEGTLGGNHVILTQCGIGKVSAAVGASELIRRFSPNCIVSTGVAGLPEGDGCSGKPTSGVSRRLVRRR